MVTNSVIYNILYIIYKSTFDFNWIVQLFWIALETLQIITALKNLTIRNVWKQCFCRRQKKKKNNSQNAVWKKKEIKEEGKTDEKLGPAWNPKKILQYRIVFSVKCFSAVRRDLFNHNSCRPVEDCKKKKKKSIFKVFRNFFFFYYFIIEFLYFSLEII